MKAIALLLVLVAAAFAAEPAAPKLPNEIKMTSGTVLRNISVVRWAADHVVLKHANGVDPIRFAYIAEPYRSQLFAVRDAAALAAKTAPAPEAAAVKTSTLSGQVFLTTMGAGAYKFSGATVTAFRFEDYEAAERNFRTLSPGLSSGAGNDSLLLRTWIKVLNDYTPVAVTTTDAEGKYRMTLPPGQRVFLFCTASRVRAAVGGAASETKYWIVPVPAGSNRQDLNSDNGGTVQDSAEYVIRRR